MNQPDANQRPKRFRTRNALAASLVLLAAALTGIWVSIEANNEPVYQGKRVTAWIDELEFTQPGEPNPTLLALIQMGPDAVPYFVRRLHRRDSHKYYVKLYSKVPPSVRRFLPRPRTEGDRADAAWALTEFGLLAQGAMPDLIQTLDDRSPYVRRSAARAIPFLGPARKNAIPALIRRLNDPDEDVRIAVTYALMYFGQDAAPAIPVLISKLHGTSESARLAFEAIGKLGPTAAPAVPTLVEILELGSSRRPPQLVMWLGQIGPAAKQALPALRKILTDQDHKFHADAADALGRIAVNDSETFEALKEALADSQCRKAVARALWQLDPKRAKGVAPKLVDSPYQWNPAWPPQPGMPPHAWPSHPGATVSLTYEDWSLLSELGPAVKDAFPDFSPLLTHTNALIRVFAATAVWYAERDADKVRNVLALEISHTNSTVKMWAALGLGKVEPDSALVIPALLSLFDDKEGPISYIACGSVGQFGDLAKPAVPAVVRALRHEDWSTRRRATATLMRIDPDTAAKIGMRQP